MEADLFHAQVESEGTSVDPQLLESAHGKGDAPIGQRTPQSEKKNSKENDIKKDVPPARYL